MKPPRFENGTRPYYAAMFTLFIILCQAADSLRELIP